MKLFCVIGEIKNDYSVVKHYAAESKYEATKRFLSECKELDFFNISITEVEEIDGLKVLLNSPDIYKFNTINNVHNIKCCCCQFNITVSSGQEKVVCTHCRTINDVNLQLSLAKEGFCHD